MSEPDKGYIELTFKFIYKSVAAFDDAMRITGFNRTDCVNRAIQFYATLLEMTPGRNDKVFIQRDGVLYELDIKS